METTPDYNIVFMQLPTTIKGFTKENEDGSYTIVINSCFDRETQIKTCKHEIKHILAGDLNSESPVQKIESVRHGLANASIDSEIKNISPMPVVKRKRKRKRNYKQHKYFDDRAKFFQEFFSESERWQIAENQHLYGEL